MDTVEYKPSTACICDTCEDCELGERLLCHHTTSEKLDFIVLVIGWFIPFCAGMIIGRHWIGIAVWGALAVIFFGYVEALILCRHCPHYAEPGFFLSCHANAGLPKIPKLDARPLNRTEKIIWLGYVLVLFLYFIPFFIISQQWLLLAINVWAFILAGRMLMRTKCSRCYVVSCPLNRLPGDLREQVYEHYPEYRPKK